MGLLVKGQWHDKWYDTTTSGGAFIRAESQFRNWVTEGGKPGPSGEGGFVAEAGRYHLYVSLACPWAHRTLIFRTLRKLEEVISVTVVEPKMLENGWEFGKRGDGTTDTVNGTQYLHQVYTKAKPTYSGRVTVPVLWDKAQNTIVNNESSEIIRMFNSAFSCFTDNHYDYYPERLRSDIDDINRRVYDTINNGVYRCGFATKQAPYEEAFDKLFATLDTVEARLSNQRFLIGEELTEADWRLFTTLVRFDAVYYSHFKCNLRRIADYPNLSNYVRDLFQHPGVAETVDIEHIKRHYYYSHNTINPHRIVPKGPELNFWAPHDRERFGNRAGTPHLVVS